MTTTDGSRDDQREERRAAFAALVAAMSTISDQPVTALTEALDLFGADAALVDRAALDYAAALRADA